MSQTESSIVIKIGTNVVKINQVGGGSCLKILFYAVIKTEWHSYYLHDTGELLPRAATGDRHNPILSGFYTNKDAIARMLKEPKLRKKIRGLC
ncbi:hypothetical protein H6777_00770 [Candidatus Nomurabacteria bacterium]|nr:hypothetical protein [Candidatus Nomurabacteria bacterium]